MAVDLRTIIPREAKAGFELKVDLEIITNLVIKKLYVSGKEIPRRIAKALKVDTEIVSQIISDLKKQELGRYGWRNRYGFRLSVWLIPKRN